MEWQPIETAPKDGTGIVLYEKILNTHYRYYIGSFHDSEWYETNWYGNDCNILYPTHWMFLSPPTE